MSKFLILSINPGSTSTKVALFSNDREIFNQSIIHPTDEIIRYSTITDQYSYRKKLILELLKNHSVELDSIDAIVGRGGLVRPIPSGVYTINSQMREDLKANLLGEHASNLGGLLAYDLSLEHQGIKAFIADPVVVDELEEVARYSGNPNIQRRSIFHALNQKATARLYARDIGKTYEELNLIVVHLGGGISVGAHRHGRVIDVNDALNGEGPFSPERSGGLTALSVAKLCFEDKYSFHDIKKMIIGKGGMVGYLGTNSVKEAISRIDNGDMESKIVIDAMIYQVTKEIGAMAVVLEGEVDQIVLTGGIAHSDYITDRIKNSVTFLAEVSIYPGEDEMRALAMNGLRVLKGEVEAATYRPL